MEVFGLHGHPMGTGTRCYAGCSAEPSMSLVRVRATSYLGPSTANLLIGVFRACDNPFLGVNIAPQFELLFKPVEGIRKASIGKLCL